MSYLTKKVCRFYAKRLAAINYDSGPRYLWIKNATEGDRNPSYGSVY